MLRLILPLIAILSPLAACKSASNVAAVREVAEAPPGDYVGCRQNPGECANSCPQKNGVVRADSTLCQGDSMSPLACFCPNGNSAPVALEPSPSTHDFVGCRIGSGECANSCQHQNGIYIAASARCTGEPDSGACFCPK